jgi:hypothetical protein
MIEFMHITGFPARRVYRVRSTDKEDQAEAKAFVDLFQAMTITNTRNKIKFIIL